MPDKSWTEDLLICPDRHRAADYPSPVPRVALLALTRECGATLQRHAMMLAMQRQSLRLLYPKADMCGAQADVR
jgi:hypothetical protein